MLRLTEVKLPIDHREGAIKAAILTQLGLSEGELLSHSIFKRSVDARNPRSILFTYTLDLEAQDEEPILERLKNDPHLRIAPDTSYQPVAATPPNSTSRPVIIGLGPVGLFAGLILAQAGFHPLILKRGQAVRERTKDTFGFWRKSLLDPESDVQFGEGGAGTFSDGKLYSQIKDPKHYGRKVLNEFVGAGAPPEILYASRPHIGTFRLVSMVEKMRATIQALGGEIRFQCRVIDFEIVDNRVRGLLLAGGEQIRTDHVVLAIGHSARDTFQMIHERGVHVEAKPFSLGFRIEHPQSLIDRARYGNYAGHPMLGAADYNLVHHASNERSVYSFCMCPGGTVVAAASDAGGVVTNGMSQYSHTERNANAGIVVGITPADFPVDSDDPQSPLAGVDQQRHWESRAYELGGSNYRAPGQLVGDFLAGSPSRDFGAMVPSYTPGVHLTDLSGAMPGYAIQAIREALPVFARQIEGFDLPDAVLTGVETRTSAPNRIRRNVDDLQSITTRGLCLAGEGAGYAGGILSAAVDGIKVAEAVPASVAAARSLRRFSSKNSEETGC